MNYGHSPKDQKTRNMHQRDSELCAPVGNMWLLFANFSFALLALTDPSTSFYRDHCNVV